MLGRFRFTSVLAACLVAVAPAGVASASDPLFDAVPVTPVRGDVEAPAFRASTPDGTRIALADYKGQVLLLNFWATWCPPCREEMPSIETLHREFREQGLVVLAISVLDRPHAVVEFMRELGLTFPALLDADGALAKRYGARGLPSTHLVDRHGRLVGRAIGPRDWTSAPAKALVRALLARPGPPSVAAP